MFWSNDLRSTKRSNSLNTRSMSYSYDNNSSSQPQSQLPQLKKSNLNKQLSQKVNKFIAINKSHQFDQVCVCQDCIYSKNLNRYQLLKMDLSKSSSYRNSYNKSHLTKRNMSNSIDLTASHLSSRTQENNISMKNPFVDIDSSYKNQYADRGMDKVEKPKPTDQLKFAGPLSNSSSYKRQYSGVNGPSQYLQMIKQQLLPTRKFNSSSLYSQSFKTNRLVQNQSAKMNDQLKLGKPLTVKQSTNKSLFNAPNPQTYGLKDKYSSSSLQKRIQTPNLSFQYNTINRDEYEKPIEKKNCRSRRMQILHGQMLTGGNSSGNYSTLQ